MINHFYILQTSIFSILTVLILYALLHSLTTKGVTLIKPLASLWLYALFLTFITTRSIDPCGLTGFEMAFILWPSWIFSLLIFFSLSQKPLSLFFSHYTVWGFSRDQVITALTDTFNAKKMNVDVSIGPNKEKQDSYLITTPADEGRYLSEKQYVISFSKEALLPIRKVMFTIEGYRTNLFVNLLEENLNKHFIDNSIKKSCTAFAFFNLLLIGSLLSLLNT